jgi:hypothetical protein
MRLKNRRPSLIYALNNLTSLDPGLRRFCLPQALEVRHALGCHLPEGLFTPGAARGRPGLITRVITG